MHWTIDDSLQTLALRQSPHDMMYPRLPGVSRKLSPPKPRYEMRTKRHRPHEPLPQGKQFSRKDCRTSAGSILRASLESWSDDSIYLEVERLHVSPNPAEPPHERVRKCLSTTDDSCVVDIKDETLKNFDLQPALGLYDQEWRRRRQHRQPYSLSTPHETRNPRHKQGP